MNKIIKFLKQNGFNRCEKNSYSNHRCNVVITELGFEIANNNGDCMYSDDHNIYWLIGVLTYYGFMVKNYKT